ncbi:MAG: hypothetical protein ACP5NS_05015 [Candidatus Pacearchaeota archaeon]
MTNKPINSNEKQTTFLVQVFAGIKENFKNRIASTVIIGVTALISVTGTYILGALAFQYRAADEIFSIKAEVQDIKDEQKRLTDNLGNDLKDNTDALKELRITNDALEKRVDRMDNKLDQVLLK